MRARQSRSSADAEGQAEAGPIIGQPARLNTEANSARVIMARFLPDRPAAAKSVRGRRRARRAEPV